MYTVKYFYTFDYTIYVAFLICSTIVFIILLLISFLITGCLLVFSEFEVCFFCLVLGFINTGDKYYDICIV